MAVVARLRRRLRYIEISKNKEKYPGITFCFDPVGARGRFENVKHNLKLSTIAHRKPSNSSADFSTFFLSSPSFRPVLQEESDLAGKCVPYANIWVMPSLTSAGFESSSLCDRAKCHEFCRSTMMTKVYTPRISWVFKVTRMQFTSQRKKNRKDSDDGAGGWKSPISQIIIKQYGS